MASTADNIPDATRVPQPRAAAPARTHVAGLTAARPGAPALEAAGPHESRPLRLAILDRDSGFVIVLLKRLQHVGWEPSILPMGISSSALASMDVDVLIVDLAVVRAKRLAWLGTLCRLRPDLRIVVCSAASSVSERVVALRLGVDDWLCKPCHPAELIARVEAVTRHGRRRTARNVVPVTVGEVEIRPDHYQAFVGGRSLQLTLREYHLLELLMRGGGDVQEREHIYKTLWGREMMPNGRSVDVFVHKLRHKLELASPGWRYIHTHYRVGYRLAAEPVECGPVLELPVTGVLADTSLAA